MRDRVIERQKGELEKDKDRERNRERETEQGRERERERERWPGQCRVVQLVLNKCIV